MLRCIVYIVILFIRGIIILFIHGINCLVLQILKDRGDLNEVWFSANVLSLKDGEALVHYTKLQSDDSK